MQSFERNEKIAELESAKPKDRELRQLYIDMTNCEYYGEDDSALGHMVPSKMIDLFGELIGFTDKPKEGAVQRITEQDLHDILWAASQGDSLLLSQRKVELGHDIQFFLSSNEGRTLLAKLNEHREPIANNSEPVLEIEKLTYDGGETYNSEIHVIGERDLNYFADGTKFYLHPQATNKAEVPDGWKLVPIEPTDLMLDAAWEIETECHNHGKLPDVSFLGELKAKECWKIMIEHSPLPPLKDGE